MQVELNQNFRKLLMARLNSFFTDRARRQKATELLLVLRWKNLEAGHLLIPVFQADVLFPKLSRNSRATVRILKYYFQGSDRINIFQAYLEGLLEPPLLAGFNSFI